MFHENDYLSWYVPRLMSGGPETINLHASGMPSVNPAQLVLSDGDPFAAGPLFEQDIARWQNSDPREVVFTPGATGGTLLALLTLAGPSSRVLVEQPMYEPMWRQALRVCPRAERYERGPDEDWRLPVDAIAARLDEEVDVILLTEPHNPSGVLAPREHVLALAEAARAVGASLLINEVYRDFAGTPSYHGAADNIVVVSSLSKLFGAYWARAGWLAAPAEVAGRLRRAHANFGMGSGPGARAGSAFLRDADRRTQLARDAAASGIDVVADWVKRTEGLSWWRPQGPGYATIALPSGTDDIALSERLHAERDVLTIPGTWFETPGTLRISWLQAGERLEEGLAAIAAAL